MKKTENTQSEDQILAEASSTISMAYHNVSRKRDGDRKQLRKLAKQKRRLGRKRSL